MIITQKKLISAFFLFIAIVILNISLNETVQSQKAESKENPSSYSSIKWLIGNWELKIPQGLVKMTFEWGAKKSYIKYIGFNPNGEIEHEGIIVWHPAKKKIIELSAFSSVANKGTPSEAFFEIMEDGKLGHYFTLFYPRYERYKDGAVETIAEKRVEYRQIWTKKGEDGLHGIFQTKRNGKWQLVNQKDKAGFNWRKQN